MVLGVVVMPSSPFFSQNYGYFLWLMTWRRWRLKMMTCQHVLGQIGVWKIMTRVSFWLDRFCEW